MCNSLKIKILTLVTLILVVIISSVAYLNFRQQKEMLHEIANRNTSVLIETIKSSVANAMLSGRSDEVGSIFARIKSREFVKSIRIVDPEGTILNSADGEEIGDKVPELADQQRQRRNQSLLPEEGVFLSYTRIFNAPQCYKCHAAGKETLGLLEIKLSLDYMNGFISRERDLAVISSILLILLTVATIFVFLVIYVERPIRKLTSYMQRVEGGDFKHEISLTSSHEMHTLGRSFNHMVRTIDTLMKSTVAHESELARTQEKLSFHHETHQMNGRLEEQIREIENLNVTLEERIEEIEEANYKIADPLPARPRHKLHHRGGGPVPAGGKDDHGHAAGPGRLHHPLRPRARGAQGNEPRGAPRPQPAVPAGRHEAFQRLHLGDPELQAASHNRHRPDT